MPITKMNDKRSALNNALRLARLECGWTQQYVAAQIDCNTDVVSRWERGVRMPSPYYQEKLCRLYQKKASELGFIQRLDLQDSTNARQRLDIQQVFTLGDIQTTWLIADGDGSNHYTGRSIRSHFSPIAQELPADLRARRLEIEQQQKEKRAQGQQFHWNGNRYSFRRFALGRELPEKRLALDLWFTPSDYYTFLATNMALDDPDLRAKYLGAFEWYQPVPLFSHSFGVQLVVQTADNQILLVYRGKTVGTFPQEYGVSICEGLSEIDALSSLGSERGIYHCAKRGLQEEIGLHDPEDFAEEDIQFLSFGVDTWYAQWALLGLVKVRKSIETIYNYRRQGVKDRLEHERIYALPLNMKEIVSFIFEHQPWMPGSLTCLYHVLVHEFGHAPVQAAIENYILRKQ